METIEVFLVEDNPADVLLVKVALSQVPFLKLLVAKDGEQALKMLSSPDFRPQLIILDLNMPRVDGQTVLQQYQQKNKVPIVIFSSTQNKAEVQKALSLGAREYVQKPIGFEPYADAVRGIVKRWIAPPPVLPIAAG
jgi:CheY-like chemotaxis protein